MNNGRITLNEAVEFHGHLGPYLVLGILAGEAAVKKLGCRKHFGLEVRVWGAPRKPKSCLIDGLQLSTGATYGKGNIERLDGPGVRIRFRNCYNNKKIILMFKETLVELLDGAKTHRGSELLAKKLYKTDSHKLFNLIS